MRTAFTTLKMTLAFYLLALIFPVSIYYAHWAEGVTAHEFAVLERFARLETQIRHLDERTGTDTPATREIDRTLSRIDPEVSDLFEDHPELAPLYTRLADCWQGYRNGAVASSGECTAPAAEAHDGAHQAIAQQQERRFEGLFLILLASMIITIAIIYVIRNQIKLQLDRRSMFDNATGLFNRNYFNAEIHKVISLSNRHGHALSLLAFSLKDYDLLESGITAENGNAPFFEFGQLVLKTVRESDVACRYDDNLFLIVTPQTDLKQVRVLAQRLLQHAEETSETFAINVGTIQYDNDESVEALMERAADALKNA